MGLKHYLLGLGTITDIPSDDIETDVDTPWIRDFYTDLYYGFSKGSQEAEALLEKNQQEFEFSDKESCE